MRIIICFILLSTTSILNGQIVYEWVNHQYNPDNLAEHSKDDFKYLNGDVSKVDLIIDFLNPDKSYGFRNEFYTYSSSRKIKKVEIIEPDGSGLLRRYYYDDNDSLRYDLVTYFMEESGLIDTVREDTNFYPQRIVLADSIIKNANGNTVYWKLNSNEVYSSFDALGRKVSDSIPASKNTEAHEITYNYRRNKLKKTVTFQDQDLTIKTIYWIDNKGNWVKAKLKNDRRKKHAIILRKIVYFND